MKEIRLFMTGLLLLVTCAASAQNITVKGTVTDATSGEPVMGASVVLDGNTSMYAMTDDLGNYSISVPADGVLVVSFLGYVTAEVPVNKRADINIELVQDATLLEEVLVVAYGTAKKESFTGSAAVVDSKKLERRPVANVTKAIDGMATGVLTTSSGQPGDGASIIVRGFGSISASNSPLYVVDGAPFDGALNSINPNDIETVTVLKDASASALYGARAANGVVMITTKSAKNDKLSISYNGSAGISNRAIKPYSMVNQRDFVNLTYESLRNSYAFGNSYSWDEASQLAMADLSDALGGEQYNPFKNYTWDTVIDPETGAVRADAVSAYDEDWMDEIMRRNAFRHEHQLSISGGNDRIKGMASLGYLNEDGILKNTGFQRFTGRANVEMTINKWIKAGLNLSAAMTEQQYMQYDGSSTANVWYSAQFMAPIYPVYLKDAQGNDLLDGSGNRQLDYGETRPKQTDFNCVGTLYDDYSATTRDNVGVRTFLTVGSDHDRAGWAKGLKLTVNFSADYAGTNNTSYYNTQHGNAKSSHGRLTKSSYRTLSYTLNELLTYDRKFGKHEVNALVGHEFYDYSYSYLTGQKTNLIDGIMELRAGTTIANADSYSNLYRIQSFLSRVNYNYDDRYYFSASFRRDGTSRFYKDSRWGNFWSVGANWRMSNEPWLKNVRQIQNLAVRASYGVQGNDNIGGYYAWQSLYDIGWPNANNLGALISSLENQDLKWENSHTLNVGVDFRAWNILDVAFEYYHRDIRDMLMEFPMAMSTGFTGYNANAGNMVNQGYELTLGVQLFNKKNFSWKIQAMGSITKNEVKTLTGDSPEIISGIYSIKEGLPVYTFYMAKTAGVDPATGAQLYWVYDDCDHWDGNTPMKADDTPCDVYRSNDYSKASKSKWYQGSRIPDLYGSLSTDFNIFNCVDVSVLTTYSIGGKIYDSLYAGSMMPMYSGDTWNTNILRRWQKPGDITDVPRAEINGKYATSDRFLIDASYFNIKNITAGYTLPTKYAKKMKASLLRVYVSLDNVALFNHLDGMDPQYSFTGSTSYVYTPNKTYTLGLNITF